MTQEVIYSSSLGGLIEYYEKTPGGTVPSKDAEGNWIDQLPPDRRLDHLLARTFSTKGKLPSQQDVNRLEGKLKSSSDPCAKEVYDQMKGLGQYVLFIARKREIVGLEKHLGIENLTDFEREYLGDQLQGLTNCYRKHATMKLIDLERLITERPLANSRTQRREKNMQESVRRGIERVRSRKHYGGVYSKSV